MKKYSLIFFLMWALLPSRAQTPPYAYSSQFGSPGSSLGQFNVPQGVATAPPGLVYVADGNNNRVQKYNGSVFTAWGSEPGDNQLNSPRGIAIDPATGNVFVTDEGHARVMKYDANGGFLAKVGDGTFVYPIAVAVDDYLFVADHNTGKVWKFNKDFTSPSTLISGFTQPSALAVKSGVLYVLSRIASGRSVTRVNTTTGATIGSSWSVSNSAAAGLAIDADANIYVACPTEVKKFTTTGTLITSFGSSGTGQLTSGIALAIDAEKNVYIAETGNNRVQKFSPLPVMAVQTDQGLGINNAGSYDFGDVLRFTTDGRNFAIKNNGIPVTTLQLSGPPYITISGPHASDFAINTTSLGSLIAAGSSSNFGIAFSPGGIGQRTATISISSNDIHRSPYTFTVKGNGEQSGQTITFNPPATLAYGASVDLGAIASSGLPVTYLLISGSASITGSVLTAGSPGTVTVKAIQSGNVDYDAANAVTKDIDVVPAGQTITFGSLATKTYGDDIFTLSASASSNLAVTFSSSNTAVATVSGSTVTIVGAGETTIKASQGGNSNYNAAPDVQQALTVNKRMPVISVTSASSGNYLGNIDLTVNKGGSPGAVTYSVTNNFNGTTGSATVNNATAKLTLAGAGQIKLTATVAATTNYNEAIATQVITINKLTPTISFTSANSGTYGANVGLAVNKGGSTGGATFSVTNGTGAAQVNGNVLILTGAGTVTLRADVAADANYSAAFVNNFTFTIAKADPVLDILTEGPTVYGSQPILLTPVTGGSTGAAQITISFQEGGNGILLTHPVSGATSLQITHVGTILIHLEVAADANFNAGHINTDISATPREVTVSGLGALPKEYDGSSQATVAGTPVLENVLPTDAATVTLVAGEINAEFADPNAGESKNIRVTGLQLSASAASENYVLTPPALAASIAPRALMAVGAGSANRVYNGTTSAIITGTPVLTGDIFEGDQVSLQGTPVGELSNKDVGSRILFLSGCELTGEDAPNYTLRYPISLIHITPRPVDISGIAANNKVYDGSTSATLSGTPSLSIIPGDLVSLTGTPVATFGDKDVTDIKVVNVTGYALAGTDAANYELSDPVLSASITPKSLTLAGLFLNEKEYDGITSITATGNPSLEGVVFGDVVSLSGVHTAAFVNKNAGPDKEVLITGLSLSGAQAGNYELNSILHSTIMPKPLEFSAVAIADKVYDGTISGTVLGTPVLTGGVIGADVVSIGGAGVATFASRNAGNGVAAIVSGYTLSGADAGNYTLRPASLMGNITPRPITITAAAGTKVYGDADPVFNYTSSIDLLPGDTFSGSLSRASGENAGEYSISAGTLTAGSNYSAGFTGATFSITKANLTAIADNITTRAGDPVPALTISYTGFRNGDTKSVITTPPVASSTATSSSPRGTYPIHLTGGNSGANYTLTLADGILTVRPPLATIQLTNTAAVYDGTPKSVAVNTTPQGVVVSVKYLLNGAAVSNPTNVGTYEVTVTVNDPAFEGALTGTLVISKANQAITFATIGDKTFGDAAFSLSATTSSSLPITYSVVASADKISLTGNLATLLAAGRVTVRAIQPGDANYNAAAQVDRTFCIKPSRPTISGSLTNPEVPVLTSSNVSGNQWFHAGVPLSGATDQTFTVTKGGVYKVQTTADDCVSEFSADFPIIVTGISSPTAAEVQAYPNPAGDFLTVTSVSALKDLVIQNTAGVEQRVHAEDHSGAYLVDVRSLPSGNYLLRINSRAGNTVIRFVKK